MCGPHFNAVDAPPQDRPRSSYFSSRGIPANMTDRFDNVWEMGFYRKKHGGVM